MDTESRKRSRGITAMRWFARGFGVLISVFFLFIFVAEAWERGASGLGDIKPVAVLGLALNALYIIAMVLALKWEHAGTLIATGALGAFFVIMFCGLFPGNVSGGFSSKGVLNPFLLVFWLPVVLYWLCWRLEVKKIT